MSNCSTCDKANMTVNRVQRHTYENTNQPVTYMPVKTTQQVSAYQQRINQILQSKTVQSQQLANQNQVTRFRR